MRQAAAAAPTARRAAVLVEARTSVARVATSTLLVLRQAQIPALVVAVQVAVLARLAVAVPRAS
jgi:hypothetical protein